MIFLLVPWWGRPDAGTDPFMPSISSPFCFAKQGALIMIVLLEENAFVGTDTHWNRK